MIQTAIVGYGLSGRYFHAPFLREAEAFNLRYIVRHSSKPLEGDCETVEQASFEQILADPDIELVVVATPNQLHVRMALELLRAGKHIVLEKPIAPDGEQARRLAQAAADAKREVFVYHNRRLDGDFLTVSKLLDEKQLGEVVEYEAHFDRWAPARGHRAWKEVDEPSITMLHDLGTHLVDQAVALFGRPREITGKLYRQRPGTRIYDGFTLLLDYHGMVATLRSSMMVRQEGIHFLVNGTAGSFVKKGFDRQEPDLRAGRSVGDEGWGRDLPEYYGNLVTEQSGETIQRRVETLPGDYMEFYRRVAGVLRGDGKPLLSLGEAIVTVDILDAALKSHREGRTVSL